MLRFFEEGRNSIGVGNGNGTGVKSITACERCLGRGEWPPQAAFMCMLMLMCASNVPCSGGACSFECVKMEGVMLLLRDIYYTHTWHIFIRIPK